MINYLAIPLLSVLAFCPPNVQMLVLSFLLSVVAINCTSTEASRFLASHFVNVQMLVLSMKHLSFLATFDSESRSTTVSPTTLFYLINQNPMCFDLNTDGPFFRTARFRRSKFSPNEMRKRHDKLHT